MTTTHLNENNIQVMEIGKNWLVYAPLAGIVFLADAATVEKMDSDLSLFPQLTEQTETEYKSRIISHPSQFTKLSILPNLKCNFKCEYCYSAQGRSNAEIAQDKLKTMLDYFVDAQRVGGKDLSIFISGGGEPLLSWDKVRFILEYSSELAKRQGLKIDFMLMTNGSLITKEAVGILKSFNVETGVSFDILPDIQNSQRGQYDKVSENIRMMIAEGAAPSISSVITGKNVHRMMEMAEEIVHNYKGIKHLNFDPAMNNDTFATAEQLDAFYRSFEDNFFKAKLFCGRHRITLDCNIVRHAEKLFPRYCQGKLCLVPGGDISMCHTVSSPSEHDYDSMIYGKVSDGRVIFDEEKFKPLVNKDNYLMDECTSCIARWHCAGGCMMYRRNYSNDKMQAVCRFTRNMMARILMIRIDSHYRRYSHLHKNEIYPLPVENGCLIYAPLKRMTLLVGDNMALRMEKSLAGINPDDEEAAKMLDTILKTSDDSHIAHKKRNVSELHKLTILPTHLCNFRCTYCYSAKGRQNKTISDAQAFGAIDYFIDRNRTSLDSLWLAVLGGGEPFMSPELTGKTIKKAIQRAKEQGFKLGIGLTTNGSIYNAELSEIMVKSNVNLGVSFEVLKDVQNEQRQHYDEVVPVVRRYMDDGVDITVKSIITPKNVCLLTEMVEELHRLFPLVKKYKLQIVEDKTIFNDLDVMRKFYSDFTKHFFEAHEKGLKYGIDVYVLASKFVDTLSEHYCGGEMCLNPEGTITVCHRFSSPAEEKYESFVYGSVNDKGEVSFDQEKFAKLMSHDIDMMPKCKECFVKWHCGGGCLAQSSIYDDERLDIICDWTRSFTLELLKRRAEGIEYGFLKSFHDMEPFEEVTDYLLKVPCVNRADILDYIYRLYRYGEHLFITDMFPRMYENDKNCFKRFTSHDGFTVNMRKLSVCCLRIFVEQIMKNDKNHVMVVSGSYAPTEEEKGESRKLHLYWHFFSPLLDELHLRAIMMPEWNAFLLVSSQSDFDDESMKNTYINFRTRKS